MSYYLNSGSSSFKRRVVGGTLILAGFGKEFVRPTSQFYSREDLMRGSRRILPVKAHKLREAIVNVPVVEASLSKLDAMLRPPEHQRLGPV